jgi:hypothetical protein
MLTCNLFSALVGIHVNTSWIWLKYFMGVHPIISSIHSILGVMWNVAFECGSGWTGSHSFTSILSSVYDVDEYVLMLLDVVCDSLFS